MLSHLRSLRQCCRYAPILSRNSLLLRNERLIKFTTQKVYLYRGVGNKLPKEAEEKWLKYDEIPPTYELIYKGKLDKYVNFVLGLAILLISATTIVIVYRIFILKEPLYELGEYYGPQQFALATSDVEIGALFFFYAILLGFIFTLTNRTVLRIYNSGEKYVAIFTSYNPMKKKQMYFTVEDVEVVKGKYIPQLFQGSGFAFKNQKVFIMEENFRSARDQIKLTGIWGDF